MSEVNVIPDALDAYLYRTCYANLTGWATKVINHYKLNFPSRLVAINFGGRFAPNSGFSSGAASANSSSLSTINNIIVYKVLLNMYSNLIYTRQYLKGDKTTFGNLEIEYTHNEGSSITTDYCLMFDYQNIPTKRVLAIVRYINRYLAKTPLANILLVNRTLKDNVEKITLKITNESRNIPLTHTSLFLLFYYLEDIIKIIKAMYRVKLEGYLNA